jgi:hypothetical protein
MATSKAHHVELENVEKIGDRSFVGIRIRTPLSICLPDPDPLSDYRTR